MTKSFENFLPIPRATGGEYIAGKEGSPASACGDKIGLSLTLLSSTSIPVGVKKVSDCVGLKSRLGLKSEREVVNSSQYSAQDGWERGRGERGDGERDGGQPVHIKERQDLARTFGSFPGLSDDSRAGTGVIRRGRSGHC